MNNKADFAKILSENISLFMTDCEKYGMAYGCDVDCPVLRDGKCQLKETENKHLWDKVCKEIED